MSLELNLIFSNPNQVVIQSSAEATQPLAFVSPLSQNDLKDIRWYLEVYSSQYTMDVDDDRARSIENSFIKWGNELFLATLGQPDAQHIFNLFDSQEQPHKVLSICASHPSVLGLPWELLHIPQGEFLFDGSLGISIRRKLHAREAARVKKYRPKQTIRILFIVSRPVDTSFINPRSDAQGVLNALRNRQEARLEIEFLRPATLKSLEQRLNNYQLPTIDVIHFDGHGVYDVDGRYSHFSSSKEKDERSSSDVGVGYLLFEDERGKRSLVSAMELADCFSQHQIRLVILSACQSGMVAVAGENKEERDISETIGSIAAILTNTGTPAVIAMTYSVLTTTAQKLFHRFYQDIVAGCGIGEALDSARWQLNIDRNRGERLRGQQRFNLELQDWFLPALYQAGADVSLLTGTIPVESTDSRIECNESEEYGNLPVPTEPGFFGRSYELHQIERAFVKGTRRISVVGFSGQGKTSLVQEAGRWLCQTRMFQQVCFVDYTRFQGTDAVKLATSTMSSAFKLSLATPEAVVLALQQTATLIILDNLEVLPKTSLQELLDAAYSWSQIGYSRVILTSSQPEFSHVKFKARRNGEHIQIVLKGLGNESHPVDALNYFYALMKLPPTPAGSLPNQADLVDLFQRVDFHTLSISLIAHQLKKRTLMELSQKLEEVLTESVEEDNLAVSLNLLLDGLSQKIQQQLLKLGVFRSGAFEDNLLVVTRLGLTEQQSCLVRVVEEAQQNGTVSASSIGLTSEAWKKLMQFIRERPELLVEAEALVRENLLESFDDIWPMLRQELISSGLVLLDISTESDIPFLKFHPNLAPVLWTRLSEEEQAELLSRHQQRYYELSGYLRREDGRNPSVACEIARKELPNLMKAVDRAVATQNEHSIEFVENVNHFLKSFARNRDRLKLINKIQNSSSEVGSKNWLLTLSREGESCFESGNYEKARKIFEEIVDGLEETLSYEKCTALNRLGLCLERLGRSKEAMTRYRQGVDMTAQLEDESNARRIKGALHNNLASILRTIGDYEGAKASYEIAARIAKQQGDERSIGIIKNQCGSLALAQGSLDEAIDQYQEALDISRRLEEPALQAIALHQLGIVYHQARLWEEAETFYRESAQISEMSGDLAFAARTWNQLAGLNQTAGRFASAASWYEKAIAAGREAKDLRSLALRLHNFAVLLKDWQDATGRAIRLASAREHAEEAVAIKQALDPVTTKIWKTYSVLAEIAEQQGEQVEARQYQLKARQAAPPSRHL